MSRRGYDTEPLPMKEDHPYWTGNDRRYRDLGALLPRGESLKQCKARILPYWYETVVPSVRAGRRVLIAAHNNVLRCLCKHLDRIPSDNLRALEIPTGDPIVYTLNRETLEPMGAPDELGFRGKFLDASDLHEEVSEHRTEETSSSSRNQLRPHRIPILILCVFPGTPTLTVSFSFKK